jgi:hypothetical protein
MNNYAFRDITPSSILKIDRLSGTYYFFTRVKGEDKQKKKKPNESDSREYLCRSAFHPRTLRRYVPPKSGLTFKALHGVVFQKDSILQYISRKQFKHSGLGTVLSDSHICEYKLTCGTPQLSRASELIDPSRHRTVYVCRVCLSFPLHSGQRIPFSC